MNWGYHAEETSSGTDISGKTKAVGCCEPPAARAAGPPESRCQYQSANAITLVRNTTAPMRSSWPAVSNEFPLVRMPTTSRPAEKALTNVIRPIISPVVTCSQRRCRSIRPGSPTTSTARNATRNAGYIQCGDTRKSAGISWWSPTAASAATAIGHRRSPAGGAESSRGPGVP